jgi:release factor glutamine methyltransferase
MKIKSNTLSAVKSYFLNELSLQYEENEICIFFKMAVSQFQDIPFELVNLHDDKRLSESELVKFIYCVKDLKKNKPIQYVLQSAWFCNLNFHVDSGVLIPRPETEELVFLIFENHKNTSSLKIIDFCTGSGCIAIALKNLLSQNDVFAVEWYDDAITICKKNIQRLNTDVKLMKADVLNIDQFNLGQQVDIIVANPPYVLQSEKNEIAQHVIDFEPHQALFVIEGNDEIIFYKKILQWAIYHLKKSGNIYFEINPLAIESLTNYLTTLFSYFTYQFVKDLAGNTRFLHLTKL